jgi:hypothetical protein
MKNRFAKAHNFMEAMQELLAKNADVNQATRSGTALTAAGRQCHLNAVQFLLEHHAAVNSTSCKESALFSVVTGYGMQVESCQSGHGHHVDGDRGAEQRERRGTRLQQTMSLMKAYSASWFAGDKDCRGLGFRVGVLWL